MFAIAHGASGAFVRKFRRLHFPLSRKSLSSITRSSWQLEGWWSGDPFVCDPSKDRMMSMMSLMVTSLCSLSTILSTVSLHFSRKPYGRLSITFFKLLGLSSLLRYPTLYPNVASKLYRELLKRCPVFGLDLGTFYETLHVGSSKFVSLSVPFL